jgi:hypothetical protein
MGNPGLVCAHVALLPEVSEQIDELWQRLRRVIDLLLPEPSPSEFSLFAEGASGWQAVTPRA